MPDQPASCLRAVEGRLGPGEDVWAVYPSARRALVATRRHLFLLDADGRVEVHELGEYRGVRRARDTLVVVEGRGGASIAVPVDPGDELGLQALTVIGLLLAADAAGRSPAPSPRGRNGAARFA